MFNNFFFFIQDISLNKNLELLTLIRKCLPFSRISEFVFCYTSFDSTIKENSKSHFSGLLPIIQIYMYIFWMLVFVILVFFNIDTLYEVWITNLENYDLKSYKNGIWLYFQKSIIDRFREEYKAYQKNLQANIIKNGIEEKRVNLTNALNRARKQNM